MKGLASHPALRAFRAVTVIGLAAHAAHTGLGLGRGHDGLFDDWLYNALMLAAVAATLARAALVRAERKPWLLLGIGLLCWSAGDLYYTLRLSHEVAPPVPSLSDVLYLAFYPAAYGALGLLARQHLRSFRASLWLDGLIAALAVSALGGALLIGTILDRAEGNTAAVVTTLAYPVGDVLLLASVAGVLAMCGWRPGRTWAILGAGLALSAIGDAVFLYLDATGSYSDGTLLDSVWPASLLLIGWAAWLPPRAVPVRLDGWRISALPCAFALLAVTLLVYGQVAELNHVALVLATATVVAVILRMAVSLGENLRLLASVRGEALTDALTGLGNRRKLMRDLVAELEIASPSSPRVLVLFDLDGFKRYNDTYGHPAGDALLSRLGHKLDEVARDAGQAYRLGGDEFCVLLEGRRHIEETILATSAALCEIGEDGFSVGNSYGAVVLPQEATDPGVALQLVDQRLYARKDARPNSARRQSTDVLLRAMHERHPELHEHANGVANFALAVGRRLGMDASELDQLMEAAELHDIGKVAVPDAILEKPAALDEVEWGFMRRHTILGERILTGAPALRGVARLVRASHERFDGTGYPDGLKGENIPLGARIVAVCDAFDAMISERPYREARPAEEARRELVRCAGSQFDPAVVEAFCAELDADARDAAAREESEDDGLASLTHHMRRALAGGRGSR